YVVRRMRYRMNRTEEFIAAMLLIGIVTLALVPFVFVKVPAGHVGVLYRLLDHGTETRFVYEEGLGIKWPWDQIHLYEVRTQTLDQTVHALASDGLSVQLQISVLFRPVASNVGRLH